MLDIHVDEIATAALALKTSPLSREEKLAALRLIRCEAEMAEAALMQD